MSDQFVSRDKVVSFTYSILDESGEIVEQSDMPISYVHGGKHDLFTKVVEAFGPHDPVLTFTDDIGNVPPEFHRVGAEVEMMNDAGESRKFTVSRIENGRLTVDGNHPLAGKTITFNITVTRIRDASPDEVANGVSPMEMPVLH